MRRKYFSLPLAVLALLLLAASSASGSPSWDERPTVPHPVSGRLGCLSCHGKDAEFAEEHQGRTNDICTMCHPIEDRTGIPALAHPTQGQEKCLTCHAAGQLKPFPADHTFQTDQVCLNCHPAQVPGTALATPAGAAAAIPHPIQGREDCLGCHGAGQVKPFPANHEGRTKDSCQACHQVSATAAATAETPAAAAASPTPGTLTGTAPSIPHPTQGREDCLGCHGIGQLKPFPADHEGRTKDTCQACHQAGAPEEPAPAPTAALPPSIGVVPTPIHEPVLFEQNSCVSCHEGLGGKHAQIADDWSESVHAKQGVGCVSCHGGDPNQADATAAMSPDSGYLGPLPKERIPGLCGSCHTRVDLMRPYNLATDQLDQYWQSQHGQALLQGDANVATCFDCHDGHRVLKVSDPASQVYPSNEPEMCARCHADKALIASYGIPSDQYELYQQSVHGVALLRNQDLRAPSCSTCHGTHGAAPPGLQQVANVCGQCHSTTEDYYLQGAHRAGMTGEAAPRCVTCHGRHDVMPVTLELFVGTEEGRCGSCHAAGSQIAGQVDKLYQALKGAGEAYAQAEATIAQATEHRLIMAAQEELLLQANTPLIESQALQHTVNLADIQDKAGESLAKSQEAKSSAEAALKELDTRRLGMVIALAVILVTILALVLIKRELDRDLEAKRARQRSRSS